MFFVVVTGALFPDLEMVGTDPSCTRTVHRSRQRACKIGRGNEKLERSHVEVRFVTVLCPFVSVCLCVCMVHAGPEAAV